MATIRCRRATRSTSAPARGNSKDRSPLARWPVRASRSRRNPDTFEALASLTQEHIMKTHPQSGILNRPPGHALVFALTLTTNEPASTRQALEALREVQRRELRSDLDETTRDSDKNVPSAETGELDFSDGYDRAHLTITIGLGKRTFDLLGVPVDEHPQDLVPVEWSQLGDNPEIPDNGDILVQVCSDSMYINEHVLRRVEEELSTSMSVTWVVQGHQRYNSRQGRVSHKEGRALIGFRDGTANLRPRHSENDRALVFIDPSDVPSYPAVPQSGQPNMYGQPQGPVFPQDLRQPPPREPDWTSNGTYCVVRASTINTPRWDREPLGTQEQIVGRFKVSGASLDLSDDSGQLDEPPTFASNPSDIRVPLRSHVRKTNPRTAEDLPRRIFRRGYPLIDAHGQGLRRGLVFICFGRTISTQFEFITRAWTINPDFPTPGTGTDPLRDYEQVIAGGYFFVPPLRSPGKPWSWLLPNNATT